MHNIVFHFDTSYNDPNDERNAALEFSWSPIPPVRIETVRGWSDETDADVLMKFTDGGRVRYRVKFNPKGPSSVTMEIALREKKKLISGVDAIEKYIPTDSTIVNLIGNAYREFLTEWYEEKTSKKED